MMTRKVAPERAELREMLKNIKRITSQDKANNLASAPAETSNENSGRK